MTKYVIIGNGVAGVNAANWIRREDSDGIIEIYTDEKYLSYARPKLPGYIADIVEFQDLFTRKEEWYKEKDIDLHLSSKVIDINNKKKIIEIENGKRVKYDKLLIAAGSHAFIPPIEGADKEKVMTIRTIEDSKKLKEIMKKNEKVVVIGGGLLGIETANSINMQGNDVTIVEFLPRLLPKQLDEDGASLLKSLLEKKGIKIVIGAETEKILGEEQIEGVKLKSDKIFPADCVVISTGIRPNVHIANKCDVKCNRGVVVNKYMETSQPDIYAAGDIAEFDGRVWGIIPVAFAQSKVAAINMVHGRKEEYEEVVPSNTLKVTDIDLTSIGKIFFEKIPENIIQKKIIDRDKGIYKKVVLERKDGNLIPIGAILLGDKTNSFEIQKLIREKIDVSEFADEMLKIETDLKKFIN
ncbi:MAG: NAD(P)/FAD-dependent oxidoreductase [Candidatus Lokiarchaeota archaeon]|nr:NAD(P)/FAD-dependent oxidoreductase [Candidatus Lokiarchaeota archaeon]